MKNETGVEHMLPNELEKFTKLHESNTLVKPKDCGYVIAALVVKATSDLSGKFISWDEDTLKSYRPS